MTEAAKDLTRKVVALREAFDRSFAEPERGAPPLTQDLLAIRLGEEPWAIRMKEIAGVFADKHIGRLPAKAPALLGLASFRGVILPAYDLHALLGLAPASALRWLVLAANAPVALAFERLEHHLRVPADTIVPRGEDMASSVHARDFVKADTVRPILNLPSIVAAITG